MDEKLPENLSKKERRELKRQEKEKIISGERQKVKGKKFVKVIFALIIAAALFGGIYYWLSGVEPDGQDFSQGYEILERSHISRPQAVSNYNSNPPTSGQHWSDANAPVARGVHEQEFPDEVMVHNLEHGEIWISYKPGIPDNVKEELRKIARDTYKVVLTPRARNDTDIAVAAWGRLDKFNLDEKPLDQKRIEDFITRYRNKGPELIP